MTAALAIRCRATTLSPTFTRPLALACASAPLISSSVVSESVARAEPEAKSGIRPLLMREWRAGDSSLICQVRLSVVKMGTATDRIGIEGRYFATRLAVEPPRVSTTMRAALTCGKNPVEEDARKGWHYSCCWCWPTASFCRPHTASTSSQAQLVLKLGSIGMPAGY